MRWPQCEVNHSRTAESQVPTPPDPHAQDEILEPLQRINTKVQPLVRDLIEGIVVFSIWCKDFIVGCGEILMTSTRETPLQRCFEKALNDPQLRVDPVLTEVLKCSRQCSSNSLNAVQGCVAVVYLSCTMRWHAPQWDTSQKSDFLPHCGWK